MKTRKWISYILTYLFRFAIIALVISFFVFDYYSISTTSMLPTIKPGDFILVNKLTFGPRIRKICSPQENLDVWRLYGWRKIKRNDIVVFNYVRQNDNENKISFNKSVVYVKRCIGLPGDTISIKADSLREEKTAQQGIVEFKTNISQDINQNKVKKWLFLDSIYIPTRGAKIKMSSQSYRRYKMVIEFETRKELTMYESLFSLGDSLIQEYEFQQNYYFMCGDNRSNSTDSRLWGFVPEDFIIGVSPYLLFSRNYNNQLNWRRFLKKHDPIGSVATF